MAHERAAPRATQPGPGGGLGPVRRRQRGRRAGRRPEWPVPPPAWTRASRGCPRPLLRPPPAPPADRGHPGDRRQPAPAEPHRTGPHRASTCGARQTPRGTNRIQLAMRLLEAFERLSILTLPARQGPGRGPRSNPSCRERAAAHPGPGGRPPGAARAAAAAAGRPTAPRPACVEFLASYHPLGYRQPIGSHLRYFLHEPGRERLLGMPAVRLRRPLPAGARPRKHLAGPAAPATLERATCARPASFCFPAGMRVKLLRSQALGRACAELAADWQRRTGSGAALLVEPSRLSSQGDRSSGPRTGSTWRQTQARGCRGGAPAKTPKAVSCTCRGTGGRSCSGRHALLTPAERPHPRLAQHRLSPPPAPRLLNAYPDPVPVYGGAIFLCRHRIERFHQGEFASTYLDTTREIDCPSRHSIRSQIRTLFPQSKLSTRGKNLNENRWLTSRGEGYYTYFAYP